ncbi:MAG: CrcB family protein [Candidatus Eremiobacteraeota bacterium]|nr:CrcB family protein [Candidatus Eremiobacteraeota bacterium]
MLDLPPTEVPAILTVAIGAALGGVLRLLITQFVVGRYGAGFAFYATLFINVSGSFAIGAIVELAATRTGIGPLWRLFLTTGLLGGYTTFSAFSYEALTLFSGALTVTAISYVAASLVLGIGGSLAGIATARTLAH